MCSPSIVARIRGTVIVADLARLRRSYMPSAGFAGTFDDVDDVDGGGERDLVAREDSRPMRCHVRRMVRKPQVIRVATAFAVALALSWGVDNQYAVTRGTLLDDDRVVLHVRTPDDERLTVWYFIRSQQPTGLESNPR
jgi:hypothetical protein